MSDAKVTLENEAAQSTNALGPLVGLAREQQTRTPSPAPAPQPQRTAQSRTPPTRPAGGGSVPRT